MWEQLDNISEYYNNLKVDRRKQAVRILNKHVNKKRRKRGKK